MVDDDEVTRNLLKEVLEIEGYSVDLASSGEDAVWNMSRKEFPIILSDIRMLDLDGIGLLKEAKKSSSLSIVILMTGFGSMEGAVQAIQEGAFDYVSKPFKIQDLKTVIHRAAKQYESQVESRTGNAPANLVPTSRSLFGKSPLIVEVYKTLARAAMSSSTVLVVGESGTGKELVARAIHDNSRRRDRKFIAVNCGALADTLLESELFGHVKGSFTGSVSDKRGLFEEANGGTLFLDEIGDITPALQIKLLRVLQEGEIKPVGAVESRKVDVRVIAATHRCLENLVQLGKFRDDLYYRLRVISIELPPLRDRMEDLPELVEHFLIIYANKNKKMISHISPEAMHFLSTYNWPGNVRELEHAIERAVAMSSTSILFPEDFPPEILRSEESSPTVSGATSLEDLERHHIVRVLQEMGFNKSKASEVLGIDRATLYRKAQKYGIDLRGNTFK